MRVPSQQRSATTKSRSIIWLAFLVFVAVGFSDRSLEAQEQEGNGCTWFQNWVEMDPWWWIGGARDEKFHNALGHADPHALGHGGQWDRRDEVEATGESHTHLAWFWTLQSGEHEPCQS